MTRDFRVKASQQRLTATESRMGRCKLKNGGAQPSEQVSASVMVVAEGGALLWITVDRISDNVTEPIYGMAVASLRDKARGP